MRASSLCVTSVIFRTKNFKIIRMQNIFFDIFLIQCCCCLKINQKITKKWFFKNSFKVNEDVYLHAFHHKRFLAYKNILYSFIFNDFQNKNKITKNDNENHKILSTSIFIVEKIVSIVLIYSLNISKEKLFIFFNFLFFLL